MSEVTGRETVVAFALDNSGTWRLARTVGALDGQFITSDSLAAGRAIEILMDESVALAFVQDSDKGLETIAGDITAWLRYQGQENLIAGAMGDPQVKGAGPPYEGEIFLSTTLRGIFGTYVFLYATDVVAEVPSVKVTGFTLSADFGNPVEATWAMIGNILRATNDAGMVNTTTDTDAVTVDDDVKQNRVIFDDNSDFLINAESGAALAVGDRLGIASFNFSFNRPQDAFAVVNVTDTGIEEPESSAFPEITFGVTLAEFDSTDAPAYLADLRSGDTHKAHLSFAKGTDFEFDLFMPRLRVTEIAPAITGPGRITVDITFQCLQATANPTGFSDANPFYIHTKNNEVSAPF